MWWRSLATGESGGSGGWGTLRRTEERWKCAPNGARTWTKDRRKKVHGSLCLCCSSTFSTHRCIQGDTHHSEWTIRICFGILSPWETQRYHMPLWGTTCLCEAPLHLLIVCFLFPRVCSCQLSHYANGGELTGSVRELYKITMSTLFLSLCIKEEDKKMILSFNSSL